MITKNVYNSSGKIAGTIDFTDTELVIKSKHKPELRLSDDRIFPIIGTRQYNEEIVKLLYDTYYLTIGEIACIFDVLYYKANHWIKEANIQTTHSEGRRNSAYGQTFTPLRLQRMSIGNTNKYICNNGEKEKWLHKGEPLPEGFKMGQLPMSDTQREKIRQAAKDGKYLSPSQIARRGWEKGKFANVNFKRGIGGYFTSQKIGQRFFFRSLLELYYLIHYLEADENIITYQYEPFHITCDNGSLYTPDFLVNQQQVVELKSYKFIFSQGGDIQKRFEYKQQQAIQYCQEHDLTYQVIFDIDINFDSQRFKYELRDTDYIQQYNIEFLQPERVLVNKATEWQNQQRSN